MSFMTDALCEAVGRITVDPAMLALFLHDREKAIAELEMGLSPQDIKLLERYVSKMISGSSDVEQILSNALRAADRTVQK
jgi:hypothetical protein